MLRLVRLLSVWFGRVVLYSAGAATVGGLSYHDIVSANRKAQAQLEEDDWLIELNGGVGEPSPLVQEDPLAGAISWVGAWTIGWGLARHRRLPKLGGAVLCLFAYTTREYIYQPAKP